MCGGFADDVRSLVDARSQRRRSRARISAGLLRGVRALDKCRNPGPYGQWKTRRWRGRPGGGRFAGHRFLGGYARNRGRGDIQRGEVGDRRRAEAIAEKQGSAVAHDLEVSVSHGGSAATIQSLDYQPRLAM